MPSKLIETMRVRIELAEWVRIPRANFMDIYEEITSLEAERDALGRLVDELIVTARPLASAMGAMATIKRVEQIAALRGEAQGEDKSAREGDTRRQRRCPLCHNPDDVCDCDTMA